MNNSFCYALNNYENPYLSLMNSIEGSEQDGSLKKLFEFIKQNTNADINETKFNVLSQYDKFNGDTYVQVYLNNIIHDLSLLSYKDIYTWYGNHPVDLFETLHNFGLDFTKETRVWNIPYEIADSILSNIKTREDFFNKMKLANIEEKRASTIFNNVNDNENRNICLLSIAYKQMPNKEFQRLVQKYSTLQQAVAYRKDKIIQFLIEDCKVDPNIQNENGATPLLFCHDFDILSILNKYNINWFAKDVFGKDCISIFTGISDKERSKKMVDFAQKRMSETFGQQQSVTLDPEYIKKRIKQNLLEMVKLDKTKKELEDFIRKYKVKDFSDIFDENGNSLAQLCIKNNNWSRYKIFKDHYPLQHTNNFNQGNLEHLFSIHVSAHLDKAKQILNELINNNIHEENNQFSFNIILNSFEKGIYPQLPVWYFGKNAYFFAKTIIGEENSKEFIKNLNPSKTINVNQYYSKSILEDTEEFNKLKNIVYFYLAHMSIYNPEADLNKLNIERIFSERNNSYSNSIDYDYNENSLATLLAIIDLTQKYENLNKFYNPELWNRFEQKAVEHLIKDYHFSKDKEYNSFVTDNKQLVDVLADRQSELFKSILNQEFVNFFKEDNELSKKLNYMLLSESLEEKKNLKKTNKI